MNFRVFTKNLNSLKIEIYKEETSRERLIQIAETLIDTLLNTIKKANNKRR